MIDRKFFFDHLRTTLFRTGYKQSQVDGLNGILNYWESNRSLKDPRWLAYMLATTYHETDKKMQPIEEYGKGAGKSYGKADPPGSGLIYYGRGFVQLTWKDNYVKMSRVTGADLVTHPEMALDLKNATIIAFYGMTNGTFTGKKFSDYFNDQKSDWVNARRIINGTDKANIIAEYAMDFYASINVIPGGTRLTFARPVRG